MADFACLRTSGMACTGEAHQSGLQGINAHTVLVSSANLLVVNDFSDHAEYPLRTCIAVWDA